MAENFADRPARTRPLLFIVLAVYCLWRCLLDPFLNWDLIGYVGAANAFSVSDPVELHALTYAQVRNSASPAAYAELINESFRREISQDASAFSEQLQFYRVRLAYTSLIYLLSRTGCDIVFATYLISGVSVVAGIVVLFFFSRRVLAGPFLYAVPPLAFIFGVPNLARSSTPDGLAFLSTVLCAYLYLARRLVLLLILLPLTVFVRSDLALFSISLPLYMLLTERSVRFGMVVSTCASLAVYFGIGACFRHAGWSVVFSHTLGAVMTHPVSAPVRLTGPAYFGAFLGGFREALADRAFMLYALVAGYSFALIRRAAIPIRIALKSPTASLAVICSVYVSGHFLAFPVVWDRLFSAPYMIGTISFLGLVSDRMNASDGRG